MSSKKRLVIIGGGFGGLKLARKVDKSLYDVVIVDRNNYHSFPPLFYQIASSGLEPASICFPIRHELCGRHYHGCIYRMGTVDRIDTRLKHVHTNYETIPYDVLVIAAGTTNNFFGMPDLKKKVFTIKSASESIRCRNEILDRLERATMCDCEDDRRRLLTFVVVGGGPAGVEIAGALGEMKRFILKREYPNIDPAEVKVVLVEGADALLRAMGPKSSADALKGLEQLMVNVKLNATMKDFDGSTVTLADGSKIETNTVIWTAGVTGVPFDLEGASVAPAHANRWDVDEYCRVKGLDDVYAIGDIALMTTSDYPRGHAQVAQVALQMGELVARNLSHPDKAPTPFIYKDKGSMATIGRNRAVVDIGKLHLSGYPAWAAWLFVHLLSLLGMRNRIVVLINWFWNYFTFSGSLRLMLRPDRYPLRSYWNE